MDYNQTPDAETETSAGTGTFEPLDVDISSEELFHTVASERRRFVLSYLATQSRETISVDDLVETLAEREQHQPGPATHRDRIEIDLYHVHLPKLADAGILEFDSVEKVVKYEDSEALNALLALGEQVDGGD